MLANDINISFYMYINNQLVAQLFFLYIYFSSLHVSSNPVLNHQGNQLYQYDIWYMSLYVDDCLVCGSERNSFATRILDGHLNRVTYTRCRIDTNYSPDDDDDDDEHGVARNM